MAMSLEEHRRRNRERERTRYAKYRDEINQRRQELRAANSEEYRQRDREYRADNLEKYRQRHQEYRAANLEKYRQRDRRYRAVYGEVINRQARERRAVNREKANQQAREWRAANREEVSRRRREWRAANREEVNRLDREWRAANREEVNRRRREWRAANREEINRRAREHYAAKRATTTTERNKHTMTDTVDTPQRFIGAAGYPLPPESPDRFHARFNGNHQYLLPHPRTGRECAFSRATTIASTLNDRRNLDLWIQRKLITAVLRAVRLQQQKEPLTVEQLPLIEAMEAVWTADPAKQDLNRAVDQLDELSGGRDAADFGTAVHAWLEALDLSIVRPCDVPEMFAEHVAAYRELLTRHALLPVPEYVERIVLNDGLGETITGQLDRLFRVVSTGALVLGDVKTSKADSLEWGALDFAVQLAVYRFARLMLAVDGSRWEPMPELYSHTAYLMHVPSDDPRRAACIALDTSFGHEGMKLALDVRDIRRRARRESLNGTIPIPSPEALRWAQARHAIQDISHPGQLAEVWEQFQEVWTDDLTQLGNLIAGLFT